MNLPGPGKKHESRPYPGPGPGSRSITAHVSKHMSFIVMTLNRTRKLADIINLDMTAISYLQVYEDECS